MMAAMSVYKCSNTTDDESDGDDDSINGRDRVLETLEIIAEEKDQSLVEYLVSAVTLKEKEPFAISYSTAVCKLINCLLLSAGDVAARKALRNEFIRDGLQKKIDTLRDIFDEGKIYNSQYNF